MIGLVVDSVVIYLFIFGIRINVVVVLKEGVLIVEVVEVIELSSMLGIYVCNIGVFLLVEVFKEEGLYVVEIIKEFD